MFWGDDVALRTCRRSSYSQISAGRYPVPKQLQHYKPNSKYEYFIHHNSTEAYGANLKKLLQIEDRKDAIRAEEIDILMAPGIMEAVPLHLIHPEHQSVGYFIKRSLTQMVNF
jgi:hypothetical protein